MGRYLASSSAGQMALPCFLCPRERLEGIKECDDRTGKTWQQRGGKCISRIERSQQMERHLLAPVYLDFLLLPINNPVLVDSTVRIEFQLDLAVTTLINTARRQDLHDQLGCCMEMSRLVQGAGQTLTADPDHIRRHVVIVGKDHARRL